MLLRGVGVPAPEPLLSLSLRDLMLACRETVGVMSLSEPEPRLLGVGVLFPVPAGVDTVLRLEIVDC